MACFPIDKFKKKEPYERQEGDPPEDEFIGSSYVFKLDADNFREFLEDKDTTLVMFYMNNEDSVNSRKQFKKAAEYTNRENHAYAAVDCRKSAELCYLEEVVTCPYFKLYSRGRFIGFNDTPRLFPAKIMKKWVESVNVYTKAGHKILPKK